MSLTILEVLQNAEINLRESILLSDSVSDLRKKLGMKQLQHAIYLLEWRNKNIYDDFNEDDLKKGE